MYMVSSQINCSCSEKENSCNNLKGEEKWKVKREKYSARV
jgi:hypothetical protein